MFTRVEKVEAFKKLWSREPIIGWQISYGKLLIEIKSIEEGLIHWEQTDWDNGALSDNARKYLSLTGTEHKHSLTIKGEQYNFFTNPNKNPNVLAVIDSQKKLRLTEFKSLPTEKQLRKFLAKK